MQLCVENKFSKPYDSVIPTLMEHQKKQLILNFLDVATQFSTKIDGSYLSCWSQLQALYLDKRTLF